MTAHAAIIGYSFRLPGTDSNCFWQDLLQERDLVTAVDPQRWALDSFLHPRRAHPGTSYTFAAGSVGDVSLFDAAFFGISPREAAYMDPQQRLLLEMAWEALENSGVRPSAMRGSRCGVYVGIASADYSYRMADDPAVTDSTMATGNTASIAANRISYVLDLQGPSMAIDTACSSSLVALHQACRAIVSGEVPMALAGGISLHLHPYGFLSFARATMLSPRGRCRVFDASADGYVRSEGGGLFLLKDYRQALADGDQILALVAGSGVNTDGRKTGLTVPSAAAQAQLLIDVYHRAGISPQAIDYLEAHGTGTAVGDPIETQAIGKALGQRRPSQNPLPIGSVKSNLGHLETAAGVAGLVKGLHCIKHRLVPPTIGVATVNPEIRLDEWNIALVTRPLPLKPSGRLIIGVNSFGFGGSNAHLILASPPEACAEAPAENVGPLPPLLVSARSEAALHAAAADLAAFISDRPSADFYDIAYTAAVHRDWHDKRALVHGRTPAEICTALVGLAQGAAETGNVFAGNRVPAARGAAFVYSGNGSQWAGMGRSLLRKDGVFSQAVREIDTLFQSLGGFSLLEELGAEHSDDRYARTDVAQPCLFAVQVGITRLLARQGVVPLVVAGHSVGEVAAAWAAGALSLADAVKVVYHRSVWQETTRGRGEMTAAAIGHAVAGALLLDLGLAAELVIAGVNSPHGVTVAGEPKALDRFEAALAAKQVSYKRLDLDYAFHSPVMDDIAEGIRQSLATIRPQAGVLPFVSTVSGEVLPGDRLDAGYWWLNVREPVRFERSVEAMLDDGINVFVEIGPHPILRGYIYDCLKARAIDGRVIPTGLRNDDGAQRMLTAANEAIIAGAAFNRQAWFPRVGRFARLPNYPWQRERHWHPVTAESLGLIYRQKVHPLLGYPLAQHTLTWENLLDVELNPLLADHVVGEAIVFPAAGFAELALAAAFVWQPDEVAVIENLEIRQPLLLGDERSMVVRTTIDARDGSLAITSREQLSHDPWVLHAVARIVPEPRDIALRQLAPPCPGRSPDFDANGHAALTSAAGIRYGQAFRCLAHGWIDSGEALGILSPPPQVQQELSTSHLHPALLDSTFQLAFQILREAVWREPGIAFVPVSLGRLTARRSSGSPGIAKASVARYSTRSLHAHFSVFAADGTAIASVTGARFRAVRLSKSAVDRLRFLSYHASPAPHPLQPAAQPAISFASVRSAIADVVQRAVLKGTHHRYSDEVDPLLDTLCSRFTRSALQRMATGGGNLSATALASYRAANPDCVPFLDDLTRRAADDLSLAAANGGWTIVPDHREQSSAQDVWNTLIADNPDYFQIVHSVGRIGLHLTRLLGGSATLPEVCPQETSLSALLRQVLGARARQRIGLALRKLIERGLAELAGGQRLGIVEISDGPPTFAVDVAAVLDFNRGDYTVATTSTTEQDSELVRLRESHPAVVVRLLEGSLPEDGTLSPAVGSCNLAVVTLDFATIEQALRALSYARSALSAGATLLVIGHHPSRWMDFVFGARRDYWVAGPQEQWLSSRQPASFWQHQVECRGFTCSEVFEFAPDTLSGPYLLLAQLDNTVAQPAPHAADRVRNWLLLADSEGYSAQLCDHLVRRLQVRGDRAVAAKRAAHDQLAALLRQTVGRLGALDGVVLLTGLPTDTAVEDRRQLLERQIDRCATAALLMQACEESATQTTCWLLTVGGGSCLLTTGLPDSFTHPEAANSDAALWGFGRSMRNEVVDCAVRMVDLASPFAPDLAAELLEREFNQTDDECEVILGARGERYVARLRVETVPELREPLAIDSPTVSLGFQFPGQLRNLRWEAHARRALAPGEVEIEVQATGLNFRDVMFALGLLADEAIENGFAGPTLGFEFAGVVRRIADRESGFAPGDEVVGFGPSSFGNRVITQASAIAHLPPGVSCETAATIPSAFFTVYYALHHLARLLPGERVLVHGAAGGVGIAAIQVARWIGAEVYATAGSDEKRDFLRLLGVEQVFDSRSLVFSDQILEATGGDGVDVVLNSLAGEAINRNLQVLRPFGRFLELGKRDFYENTRLGLRPFRNNISYFGIDADQLMLLQPDLTKRLFRELMALFAEGTLHPLPYRSFEAEDVVSAFRYMQQARQIGKIVVTYYQGISRYHQPVASEPKRLRLDAGATYLVTGGLRGFGLRAAQWLASKGARHLILLSRGGAASEDARAAIEELRQQGVQVHAAACDVTDREALASLLAETKQTLPPLKGVLHAATVIDDRLVRNTDAASIRRAIEPKALGAIHLDALTREHPLELFVLFSSATTAFGNPGQASYVAANACLEALALRRRAEGLCATCLGWGPIADAGFLARHEKARDALESRLGGAAIGAALALDALERVLLNERSGLAVLDFDWNVLKRVLPAAGSPQFRELAWYSEGGDAGEERGDDIQRLLAELPEEELMEALSAVLRAEIGEILRIAPEKIDSDRSLYDLGLDSLMGVELALALDTRFGIRLPVMALSQSPTIHKLAERVLQQLRDAGEGKASAPGDLAAQAAVMAEQQGVEVTDEAIEQLAAELRATTPGESRSPRGEAQHG